MSQIIDTLIISGGGSKALSAIGTLNHLEKNLRGFNKNIKKYAGSSMGSILIFLLSINYTPDEIYDTFFAQNRNTLLSSSGYFNIPYNLIYNYGMFSTDKIMNYISTLAEKKGIDKNITFKELYLKTNKVIVITGTSLNTRNTYYFNYDTTPDIKVIDAIRISISIPFYFTSVDLNIIENGELKNHRWVDGGLLSNFPLYYFDICEETGRYIMSYDELSKNIKTFGISSTSYYSNVIGIMFLNDSFQRDIYDYYDGNDAVKSLKDFVISFMETILTKIEEANFFNPLTGTENFFTRTITVKIPKHISSIDFNMTINKGWRRWSYRILYLKLS